MDIRFPQTFSAIEANSDADLVFLYNNPLYTKSDINRLKQIFNLITYPFVIFIETEYVDKVYRDSYYTFFSNKHITHERNCIRISLFKGTLSSVNIEDFSDQNEDYLKSVFVGTIVIRPLSGCFIGRSLLAPSKLNIQQSYIRTTNFNCIIYGHEFCINAFPFSSQDSETMTCAETSVWSILEYYGTRYPEYKTVLPSNMIKKLEDTSYERNLPSRGLTYQSVTSLLKTFGFSPRLYAKQAYIVNNNKDIFRRIMHYYIESGIPVALGIERKNNIDSSEEKHSIVAIGHAKERISPQVEMIGVFPVINSADFYNKYVIMDDNSIPYTVEQYDKFSIYNNGEAVCFSVPLYKRIFLEAKDAEDIFYELLKTSGLQKIIQDTIPIDLNTNLVLRIFLTSSRKYKKIRATGSTSYEATAFYQQLIYPKFLWDAEITTLEKYNDEEIYGEIVLDATSDRNNPENSIICMRFLDLFSYRLPNEPIHILKDFDRFSDIKTSTTYKMYINNLIPGGS